MAWQAGKAKALDMNRNGFSIIEIVLAAALFMIVASGIVGVILRGVENNRSAAEQTQGVQFLSEGFEAVRSIKQQGYANLVNTSSTGVVISSGIWTFSGTNNTFGKFTRTIAVASVNRDGSGNIVASGGTLDPQTKKITVTVTWNVIGNIQPKTITANIYLTNWKKRGVLVYGNGGTTTDDIQYQIFDPDIDTWSTAASVADVDSGSTNRATRAVRLYSSPTRNEKILLSRHYNGTTQYIYAQVYDGLTWGNVQLLSSWTAGTFMDVRNFDGTYLNNGDFMAVFSDNSTTPNMAIWNGSTWSSLVSLQNIGGIPTYIVTRTRSGSNEVMAAFFDQSSDTNTQYFNGGTYITGNWTLHAEHDNAAPENDQLLIDFTWSPNSPLKGGLAFTDDTGDKSQNMRIWTADGSGGGSWGAIADSANQANKIGPLSMTARNGADEFIICNKDAKASPQILCYTSNFTPTVSEPTNNLIVAGTATGIQKSFDVAYETFSGNPGLIVYSDDTATPKFKKYNPSTSTWDAAATSITTTGTPGTFQTVRTIPNPYSDDMMILMTDANLDVFSILWDGQNNAVYSTPAARAFTTHGTSGSASTEYWYDFAWDY